jgi:aspartyl-tRNA(Asn)/glutamyl-tRNA(Gln) amidotransferase subunit A
VPDSRRRPELRAHQIACADPLPGLALDDLCFTPATELARLIRSGEVSAAEVAGAHLDRVERVNEAVNAIVWCDPARVMAAAQAADEALAGGADTGPLHGVPLTVKGLTPVAGAPHTLGLRPLRDVVASETAVAVGRLLEAGAVLLGITNTSELGYSAITDNHLYGPTRNPWHLDRVSGGSSGGAAAAVAAGLGPLAEGTDGAGSIRIPASACGVFGLKPSLGRIPQTITASRFGTFAVHGPITRTVADAALMLDVMAGPSETDPLSLPPSGDSYADLADEPLDGWRVAFSPDLGFGGVDPEVERIAATAAETFAELGCEVERADPGWAEPDEAMWEGVWAPAYAGLSDMLDWEAVGDEVDEELVQLIRAGRFISAETLARRDAFRGEMYDRFARFMLRYDLLLTPTLRVEPFRVGERTPPPLAGSSWGRWALGWLLTHPFNMTATPAASVPCGFTEAGLPVGLQIAGRRLADGDVLRASRAFERARPWAQRVPPLGRSPA